MEANKILHFFSDGEWLRTFDLGSKDQLTKRKNRIVIKDLITGYNWKYRKTRSKADFFLLQALTPGGEALGYFLGGYVPPGTTNWHPVLKKGVP